MKLNHDAAALLGGAHFNAGRGFIRKDEISANKMRTIEMRIISAQDLKKARLQLGRMKAYAVAYVEGDHHHQVEEEDHPNLRARTRVDEQGGQNPVWNDMLTIAVLERYLYKESLACLTIDIFSKSPYKFLFGAVRGDKLVGTVRIFLSDVLKLGDGGSCNMNPIQCSAFWVRVPATGEPHGILNVWIPPSGKFLRRQHNSEDFARMLDISNKPVDASFRFLRPARALSLPDNHGDSYERESFTFKV